MQIFVTGGTGVLGRRVVPLLVACGHDVNGLARTDAKARQLAAQGADPVVASMFDAEAMQKAVAGHDAVLNLATNIPSGLAAGTRRGWRTNDRIRAEGSKIMTEAARASGVGRFVQESIAFPYADAGDEWIDEQREIQHHWGTRAASMAEEHTVRFAADAGQGVVLRFAMFVADDSAHQSMFAAATNRGWFPLPGPVDSYFSMVDIGDAATAVVSALDAPSGIYNVAEDQPATRGELSAAMAATVGRDRLRRVSDRLVALGGTPARAMMRSLRIANRHLRDTTSWRPDVPSVAAQWPRYG